MNTSRFSNVSRRLIGALQKTLRRSPERTGHRLLAWCEREERRIRERVALVKAKRAQAQAMLGGARAARNAHGFPTTAQG